MYTIGIDLGGTNIAIGLCDDALKIIDKDSVPTLADRPGEDIVADMAALTKKIIERNGLKISDVEYVGIATPGTANSVTGVVEYANNLPFKNFPISELFIKALPVNKVIIDNDANAAALGEALAGAAKDTKSSVMITLGTGVGGGIILDGKIYSGGLNCSGAEIGHTVISVGGRQCSCGRRGCFEAYSSATALTSFTKEKMHELELLGVDSLLFEEAEKEGKISARTAFNAAKRGDTYAQGLVDDYVTYLAAGITNVINVFQPEVVSIGGGVSGEGENLLAPLRKIVNIEQYTRDNPVKAKLVKAVLGNDAGIVGAAGLGKHTLT